MEEMLIVKDSAHFRVEAILSPLLLLLPLLSSSPPLPSPLLLFSCSSLSFPLLLASLLSFSLNSFFFSVLFCQKSDDLIVSFCQGDSEKGEREREQERGKYRGRVREKKESVPDESLIGKESVSSLLRQYPAGRGGSMEFDQLW